MRTLHLTHRCLGGSLLRLLLAGVWISVTSGLHAQEPAPAAAETAPEAEAAQAVVYDTPEAVFAAAQAAFNERDWHLFFTCVALDRRDELVGEMAVTFASMAKQPGVDERIAALVEKHLPPDFDAMEVMLSSDNPRAEVVRLAQRMDDPEGFYADAMTLAIALRYGNAEDAVTITALSDLKFNEKKTAATGNVTITSPDSEEQQPWAFERYEDSWFLAMK